jgi:glycogen debranching enzyme
MSQSNLRIVREHIEQIMPRIERPAEGKILFPWLSVTYGDHYASTIYTWDYHHAAMRFAIAGKPQYLRFLVDNLTAYQQSDGHTPHMVQIDRGPRFLEVPSHAQPFLMQAALMYVELTGDTRWGGSVFDKLVKYLNYFDTAYSTGYGLLRWRVGWMGGLDNDAVTAFVPPDTIASCDINGWVYMERLAGARLARLLERAAEADVLADQARRHREIVNDKLWHKREGTYSAYSLCDGGPFFRLPGDDIPEHVGRYAFQSCSNLMPLYARMAEPDMAREMITRYVINDEHFWSPYGIRTLSKASEYFNNAVFGNPSRFGDHRRMTESNWQGPVWSPINYFVFHALRHYGFVDEAKALADRAVDVLANSLRVRGSFAENFSSETGEPLYATCLASWNLLIDTLHDDLATGRWIMDGVFR